MTIKKHGDLLIELSLFILKAKSRAGDDGMCILLAPRLQYRWWLCERGACKAQGALGALGIPRSCLACSLSSLLVNASCEAFLLFSGWQVVGALVFSELPRKTDLPSCSFLGPGTALWFWCHFLSRNTLPVVGERLTLALLDNEGKSAGCAFLAWHNSYETNGSENLRLCIPIASTMSQKFGGNCMCTHRCFIIFL